MFARIQFDKRNDCEQQMRPFLRQGDKLVDAVCVLFKKTPNFQPKLGRNTLYAQTCHPEARRHERSELVHQSH